MKGNLALKRFGAYLIDIVIVSLICSILTSMSFINPKYDEYVETSKEYNEILNRYYESDIDINELNKQTQDISYEMSKNGYTYIVIEIVITFSYFGIYAYFKKGQTLGKKLLNIQIVSNKEDIDLKPYHYFIRVFILNSVILNIMTLIGLFFSKSIYLKIYSIGANIDTILLIVIVLMVLFQKNGRGLHDVLAGTKVIDLKSINENTKEKIEVISPKK